MKLKKTGLAILVSTTAFAVMAQVPTPASNPPIKSGSAGGSEKMKPLDTDHDDKKGVDEDKDKDGPGDKDKDHKKKHDHKHKKVG